MVPWQERLNFRTCSGRCIMRTIYNVTYRTDTYWQIRRTDDMPYTCSRIPYRYRCSSVDDSSVSWGLAPWWLEAKRRAGKGTQHKELQHSGNGKNTCILGACCNVHFCKCSRNNDGKCNITYRSEPDRTECNDRSSLRKYNDPCKYAWTYRFRLYLW